MEELVKVKLIPDEYGNIGLILSVGKGPFDCFSWMIPREELRVILNRQSSVIKELTETTDEIASMNQVLELKYVYMMNKYREAYPKIKQIKDDFNAIYKSLHRLKKKLKLTQ